MSVRHIHNRKTSSACMIKKSLMGSALAAGLASATLMGTQTAWAQSETLVPQEAHAPHATNACPHAQRRRMRPTRAPNTRVKHAPTCAHPRSKNKHGSSATRRLDRVFNTVHISYTPTWGA